MKILIIEDDRDLALAISEYLELHRVECDFAYTGASGITLASQQHYDGLILDNMLPKVQGIDVCRQLRANGVDTPILMLTACDMEGDQMEGFNAGVDDYVIKPCTMPLLLARLNALYRRRHPERECIRIADLRIYPKEHRAIRAEQELKLTPTSWKILLLLARRSPAVVSRNEIVEHVWPGEEVEEGTVNVHLHQLRKVVDKPFEQLLIHTHVGVGLSLFVETR
ncbi:response regulator transcription factor [Halomonas sp. XH26]|uniref:response regulator transcription factor n=1 Tax=unclassified Halomonas TaxID=2609666 RepID=UPI000B5B2B38|nr:MULTISPECIES: response regulator transcription factor [unclassified Halomonas]ASK18652.1 two-component system response regulator [Halomonas sp. N3-2A]UTA81255.1 response regulator transcription factor [Halomonas sp. XH26]